jgi:hypothetical protein
MKVFILEDDLERIEFLHKWVRLYLINKEDIVFTAKSFVEACEVFKDNNFFDIMLLDHDLKFRFMDSSEEETGYNVAKYMIEYGITYDQCIIHSVNTDGANGMHKILPHSVIIPIFALGFKYDIFKFAEKKRISDLSK